MKVEIISFQKKPSSIGTTHETPVPRFRIIFACFHFRTFIPFIRDTQYEAASQAGIKTDHFFLLLNNKVRCS